MKIGTKVRFEFIASLNNIKTLKDKHKYNGIYIGNSTVNYRGSRVYVDLETLKEIETKEKVKKEKREKKVPLTKRISKLKKECDSLWSKAVRLRDKGKCVLCGSDSHCQAHHWYHTRAQGNSTRWNINNGITLCYTCHLYKVHSGAAYYMNQAKDAAIRIIGQEALKELDKPETMTKYTEQDFIEIRNNLKKVIDNYNK